MQSATSDPSSSDANVDDLTPPRSDSDNQSHSSARSTESCNMRERQNAINTAHPFGIRLWKPALYRKKRSVEQNAEEDIHSTPNRHVPFFVFLGNIIWTFTFGLLLFSVLMFVWVPIFLLSPISADARRYSQLLRTLAFFFLVPFGKFVQLNYNENYREEDDGHGHPVEDFVAWGQSDNSSPNRLFFAPRRRRPSQFFTNDDRPTDENISSPRRLFGRGRWSLARVVYYIGYYLVLLPVALILSCLCWLSVFTIPMARVILHMLYHMRIHPLALSVGNARFQNLDGHDNRVGIVLCTYRAFGLKYYKYTVDGTNVVLLNMLFVVFLTVFDSALTHFLSQGTLFVMSLVSIIPLAHFIGQAVASISAQSSMSMGATINAFFSTIVEVYLYLVALGQGKGELVEGSITGSVLAGVLLMPGLSMCTGAFYHKTQRFNPKSAGATSTMLMYTVVGVIGPTIFYSLYGPTQVKCQTDEKNRNICWSATMKLGADDATYQKIIKPFGELCAVALFITYAIGLLFTLRTHAALIWANSDTHTPEPEAAAAAHMRVRVQREVSASAAENANIPLLVQIGQNQVAQQTSHTPASNSHGDATWGRKKSYAILLTATFFYAMIAEVLVKSVDIVLLNVHISQRMLGLTVFALVPNTTEFLNAISFALYGNVSLSLEIGSAYALQVCLLQIPALVLLSQRHLFDDIGERLRDYVFVLLFPKWDTWAWIFSMLLYCHVHSEGRSNYFKGSILILAYMVIIIGFYFIDIISEFMNLKPLGGNMVF